jgi:hypothetical protein
VSGLQLVQVEAAEAPSVEEYLPAPQSTQELATVAPVVVRYFPAPQGVQAWFPCISLYFPVSHGIQVPPFGPVNPRLQIQATNSILPPGDTEPDGQFVHVPTPVAPTIVEYELMPQSIHVLGEEATKVVEYLPAVHSTQELATVAPVVVRYFPAPQGVQAWFPCIFLYFPSSHAIQVPPFGPVNPRLQIQATKAILPPGDTEPDGQFVHVPTPVAPTIVEYELMPQSIHVLGEEATKVVEYLPAVHSTQELATVAPVVVRYFPAPQGVQAWFPCIFLYFPSSHAIHVPPFGPVNPRLQIQATKAILPPGDTEPDGQFVHVPTPVAPTIVEYELMPQSIHVLGEEATKVVEYLPAVHSTQELATVAPVVVRYFPAPQGVQAWFPCIFLYFPSSHAIHVPPFGPVNPRLQIQATNSILPPGDTEPDGQFVHVPTPVAPTIVEYELMPQSIHVLGEEATKVVEYLPAVHSTQELATVAPVVVRYFPAPQGVQAWFPCIFLYFPSSHAIHVPPFGPVNPRLQIQATKAILPPGDTEPDGQFVHVPTPVAPTIVEYELMPQSIHALGEEATKVVEYLPAVHSTQELATVAPVVVRYFPAPQGVQAWFPCIFLYFPSSHAIHVPPFGPVNPRLQIQATKAILPPGDTEPDGQFVHVPTPVAPTAVE